MTDLVRVAEGVCIPVEMMHVWERLSELASELGPVFETDMEDIGLNLRPILNLNFSIGGEQAVSFGRAKSAGLQFILRRDIYRAMVGTVLH